MSPGALILQSELTHRKLFYTRLENLKILAGSWNVGQERAYGHSLKSWLGDAAREVGLVVNGLQEVEIGAGFLATAATKETVLDTSNIIAKKLEISRFGSESTPGLASVASLEVETGDGIQGNSDS
ncbi:type II inositol polyphosphate 5-phosphatase 15-like [Canna indica]|uniref:Type II inositol polyphosphate 5-phosphatase 15-like n=1 Tax=Canna indica TaxID=4628 RepID=A0AAQ3K4E9_9LILI|nr:type II inositol polyphosphate 5-phosphatase 15-like [Canna indica]